MIIIFDNIKSVNKSAIEILQKYNDPSVSSGKTHERLLCVPHFR